MPYFEVEPGVRLHYQDHGHGRPIVFVHGLGGASDAWDYQVLDLADHFRCITLDLRGHGESDKPWGQYTYQRYCADLLAFLTGLELSDVTLVGWSMGGHIALKYVATIGTAVARLVTTGSGPRFFQDVDAPYGPALEQLPEFLQTMRLARFEMIDSIFTEHFHRKDLTVARDLFVRNALKVPPFASISSFESTAAEDIRPALGSLGIPVAAFTGRHDTTWDPRWSEVTASLVPGAWLRFFDNSAHAAFIEDRVAWNQELVKFIEAH